MVVMEKTKYALKVEHPDILTNMRAIAGKYRTLGLQGPRGPKG
jgi:hypothetical protein